MEIPKNHIVRRQQNVYDYSGLSRELGGIKCTGMVLQEHQLSSYDKVPCPTAKQRSHRLRFGRPCLVTMNDAGKEVVQPPHCGLAVDVKDTMPSLMQR